MTTSVGRRTAPAPTRGAQPWRPSARHLRLAGTGGAVGTLAIASVVVVALLWLAGGNADEFAQVGGPMTAAGAIVLVLVLVTSIRRARRKRVR